METERRSPPLNWVSRGQPTRKEIIQSLVPVTPKRRAGDPTLSSAPGSALSLSPDETRQLLRQLQLLTDANAELEAFNATVSHDLCTPLTAINGYCQVLKEICKDQLDETSREFLQGIYQGTLRMKEQIRSLLEFSRVSHAPVRREEVDLSAMAQAVAVELRLTEPKREVTFRIAKGIKGNGDPGLWRSVLDNLIGNAWKYSAVREKAVIETGRTKLAGTAVYFVRDNGSGFDPAQAARLFAPFQHVTETGVEGHGIGLATVDRIVKRHGGEVWAESTPDAGATFYFTMG